MRFRHAKNILQDFVACTGATARWADIPGPFLGNFFENRFSQQQIQTQQQKSCIFCMVRAELL
jgi:hypothetical protein